MIKILKADGRGNANHGWLNSFHTFSFADYYHPQMMGYRNLRVINEDRVQGGQGFGSHSHRDMEIISYVIDGELEHQDSMGNGSVIRSGDVQLMSAGSGVTHREKNHSSSMQVHFLQIWVLPSIKSAKPGYEQKTFTVADKLDRIRLVISPDGREGTVTIHQDVCLYSSILSANKTVELSLNENRHAWVQVVKGEVLLNGQSLKSGDGAAIDEENLLKFCAREKSELLVFDLA